jgi:hypothetical protein
MDRRDFLAAWVQALLLAIFPFLRERPLAARRLAEELTEREMIRIMKSSIDCPIWNMPVIEQVGWTISGPLTDDDVQKTFGDRVDIDDFVASRLR